MLLKAGANPTLKDDQGYAALAYAEEGYGHHQDGSQEQAGQRQCIDLLANGVRSWTVRRLSCWGADL